MQSDISRTWLNGKLLLATPTMNDPRFEKAVIFICAHDHGGAMGIMINHERPDIVLSELLAQFSCSLPPDCSDFPVFQGGPVETARGLLLHSSGILHSQSIRIDDQFAVTGTIDALRDIISGTPSHYILFALGYAGWSPHQLENELAQNAWLVVDADFDLVFKTPADAKWHKALKKLGVDPNFLASTAGHA
jgi:putative transcriptional regulator